jgi:hypothetical protein
MRCIAPRAAIERPVTEIRDAAIIPRAPQPGLTGT